jgi:hypothetical protein
MATHVHKHTHDRRQLLGIQAEPAAVTDCFGTSKHKIEAGAKQHGRPHERRAHLHELRTGLRPSRRPFNSPSSSARNFATPARICTSLGSPKAKCTSLAQYMHGRSHGRQPSSGDTRAGTTFWVETLHFAVSPSSSARNFATPTQIRVVPRMMRAPTMSLDQSVHGRSYGRRSSSGDNCAGQYIYSR